MPINIYETKTVTEKLKFKKHCKCPNCGGKSLLLLGVDQLCMNCDWMNSVELVDAGHMDSLFGAFKRQFGSKCEIQMIDQSKNGPNQEVEAAL